MKKITLVLLSFLFISIQSVKAEVGFGITGALHMLDASGTETIRSSAETNTGSHAEDVMVPELFLEAITDNGGAVGISYIPTRDVGSKSRTDTGDQSAGTYKAEAELDNVIQLYADIPTSLGVSGYDIYAKVGIQHATIKTLESLNSGSSYPDQDVLGYTLGFGSKGDLPVGNLYYKAEATYTAFEDYDQRSDSTPANSVTAELEDIAVKLSIGYKF